MAVLVGIALLAGMVTAISPCVLPVLPIVFAGGATGGSRRPYAIAAGLVVSFTAFTLAAAALLSALGLPQDLLRNIAIGVVALMGLSLLVPRLGELLARPFAAAGRRRPGELGGGFLLGLSLGLLFTPCAGPVIAAIATVAATQRFSVDAVLVTLAYALGAGSVLLVLAILARRGASLRPLRARAPLVRRVLGATIVAVAVLMAFGLDTRLSTRVPGYAQALQGLEGSGAAASGIDALLGRGETATAAGGLDDQGAAPEFAGVAGWLNSPPLTMSGLRGKVVLIDFWTYSCVNCLRTLPYLTRWDATYRADGLVIVGVHTPEFAFEREPANVRRAVGELGIRYPVALDPDYGTWNAWANRYWPAEYLVDRLGRVRYVHFGEGEYEEKERAIRELLAEPALPPPVAGSVTDRTPSGPQTPETYVGYGRIDRVVGGPIRIEEPATFELPGTVPEDHFAFGGTWTVEEERATAGPGASLRLHFRGRHVYLVLGSPSGPGTVQVSLDGVPLAPVEVDGHRLYELASPDGPKRYHLLDLRLTPGLEAYAFTFG